MRTSLATALTIFFCCFCHGIKAQTLEDFAPRVTIPANLSHIAIQPDGKVIVVGDFQYVDGQIVNSSIVRFNTDGSRDDGFDFATTYGGEIREILVQTDGKVILAGQQSADGIPDLYRLNPDGSLDQTFSSGVKNVQNIVAVEDGKFLVVSGQGVFRINEDGSGDTSFKSGDIDEATDIAAHGEYYYLLGEFSKYNGQNVNNLIRLDLDGDLDNSFDANLGFPDFFFANMIIQSDGKPVIGGDFTLYNGTDVSGIVRLNLDGSLDQSFQTNGRDYFNSPFRDQIFLMPQDRILHVAFLNSNEPKSFDFVLLNKDGQLEESFTKVAVSHPNRASIIYPKVVANMNDGLIYAVGKFDHFNSEASSSLVSFDLSGTPNPNFTTRISDIGTINTMAKQEDGKILIGGNFLQVNDKSAVQVARINPDGTLDESFQAQTSFFHGTPGVNEIAIRDDGKIYLGAEENNDMLKKVVRLNSDGTLDLSFDSQIGGTDIQEIIPLPNNQVFIGGDTNQGLNRLNEDGSPDPSFQLDQSTRNVSLVDTSIFENNLLIYGGRTNAQFLRQIDMNGNTINDFQEIDLTKFIINSIDQLSDGNILLSGYVNDQPGPHPASMKLIDRDGNLIQDFLLDQSGPVNPGGPINDTWVSGSDKILIAGRFHNINGTTMHGLARMNLDENFLDLGIGVDKVATTQFLQIKTVLPLGDGGLLFAGSFYSVNDEMRSSIAMIKFNDIPIITGITQDISTEQNTPVRISLDDFIVDDSDNIFPDDFTFRLTSNDNYFSNGDLIVPDNGFVGTLSVRVTVFDGKDRSPVFEFPVEVTGDVVASVEDELLEQGVQVYPNPSDNRINLVINNGLIGSTHFEISLLDTRGGIISSEAHKPNEAIIRRELDTSMLDSGFYLIRITASNHSTLIKKVMVRHY